MQILSIDGHQARCHAGGVEREVSLYMLMSQPLQVGDYVMVHVGYAIQKIDPVSAQTSWQLYDQLQQPDKAD